MTSPPPNTPRTPSTTSFTPFYVPLSPPQQYRPTRTMLIRKPQPPGLNPPYGHPTANTAYEEAQSNHRAQSNAQSNSQSNSSLQFLPISSINYENGLRSRASIPYPHPSVPPSVPTPIEMIFGPVVQQLTSDSVCLSISARGHGDIVCVLYELPT